MTLKRTQYHNTRRSDRYFINNIEDTITLLIDSTPRASKCVRDRAPVVYEFTTPHQDQKTERIIIRGCGGGGKSVNDKWEKRKRKYISFMSGKDNMKRKTYCIIVLYCRSFENLINFIRFQKNKIKMNKYKFLLHFKSNIFLDT